jgi:hypothetical protein
MPAPDFVTVGHVARDLVPGGWRAGGTITFAAIQAHKLGCSVGVVTRAGPEIDLRALYPFAEIAANVSRETTTFENVYEHGVRRQHLRARGEPIDSDDVPVEWLSSPVALVGPLMGEIDPALPSRFAESTLVGVSVQGWLRNVDDEGAVIRARWDGPPFWRGADVIFVSDEDLVGGRDDTAAWCAEVSMVAMTESRSGLQLWAGGRWWQMDAFPEEEIDPTGAGDTFATAFLIGFRETGDFRAAARFGAAAASLAVGGAGAEAQPGREAIEQRMRAYPEIMLR